MSALPLNNELTQKRSFEERKWMEKLWKRPLLVLLFSSFRILFFRVINCILYQFSSLLLRDWVMAFSAEAEKQVSIYVLAKRWYITSCHHMIDLVLIPLICLQQKLSILAKDSGAGFLIEDEEVNANSKKEDENASSSSKAGPSVSESGSSVKCLECNRKVISSFLKSRFDLNVCDGKIRWGMKKMYSLIELGCLLSVLVPNLIVDCRDDRGRHDMITRTDAKSEYLLKDCDLDSREPPLKFILKKNPHEKARGDMKLYLRLQVEERALEVWESMDALDEEKEKRGIKRKERKQKQYQKTIKQLRMSVQSSLFTKSTSSKHEHEFSEKVCIDEDNDMYQKTCQTCGHVVTFEELWRGNAEKEEKSCSTADSAPWNKWKKGSRGTSPSTNKSQVSYR